MVSTTLICFAIYDNEGDVVDTIEAHLEDVMSVDMSNMPERGYVTALPVPPMYQ